MESEYIALITPCKDLLLSVDFVREIGTVFGLPVGNISNMHVRVHEDNISTLMLRNLNRRPVKVSYMRPSYFKQISSGHHLLRIVPGRFSGTAEGFLATGHDLKSC